MQPPQLLLFLGISFAALTLHSSLLAWAELIKLTQIFFCLSGLHPGLTGFWSVCGELIEAAESENILVDTPKPIVNPFLAPLTKNKTKQINKKQPVNSRAKLKLCRVNSESVFNGDRCQLHLQERQNAQTPQRSEAKEGHFNHKHCSKWKTLKNKWTRSLQNTASANYSSDFIPHASPAYSKIFQQQQKQWFDFTENWVWTSADVR